VTSGQRVLVVDGLAETEQVLKAVLEPHGLRVDRVRHHNQPDTVRQQPSVVVIHQDEPIDSLTCLRKWQGVPTVIIGTAQLSDGCCDSQHERYLAKPFQYRDLILAVERLLAESA
jgi:CheY-like chemotaxis protein